MCSENEDILACNLMNTHVYMNQVESGLIKSEKRSEVLIKHRALPFYHYGYRIIKRTHVLIYAHNGYPRTFTMGLSRILKSFSTISFAWFYLFIMLDNAEAKIGRHKTNNTNTLSTPAARCVGDDKIVMCI
jgi:hypothetical protein